jgi:hypothetical protein
MKAIMQLDPQLWNNLLWLSGGMLELSKCSLHHIHFDFLPDGMAMISLAHHYKSTTKLQISLKLFLPNQSFNHIRHSVIIKHMQKKHNTIDGTPYELQHKCKTGHHKPMQPHGLMVFLHGH